MMSYLLSSVFENQVAEFIAMIIVVFIVAFILLNSVVYFTKLIRVIANQIDYISMWLIVVHGDHIITKKAIKNDPKFKEQCIKALQDLLND